MSLVITDTFNGQDNDDLRELCVKTNSEMVFPPSKFQPLDLSVNKAAKAYFSEKYNTWMAKEISKQLKKGIPLPDVKGLFSFR